MELPLVGFVGFFFQFDLSQGGSPPNRHRSGMLADTVRTSFDQDKNPRLPIETLPVANEVLKFTGKMEM